MKMIGEIKLAKFEETIHLEVDDLSVRRKQLEEELRKTVVELLFFNLKKNIKAVISDFEIDQVVSSVKFDFYYESDDEGGQDPYLTDYRIIGEDGSEIDIDDLEKEVQWGGTTYTETLKDQLDEKAFEGYVDDLHNYNITEIPLD
ncbi:hypothetical protein [Bacillus pumilus]|uniref:hypothetical protein n=1 Tax=Bacillus pumilus TaxID=1408 RepID=UPI003CFC3791